LAFSDEDFDGHFAWSFLMTHLLLFDVDPESGHVDLEIDGARDTSHDTISSRAGNGDAAS